MLSDNYHKHETFISSFVHQYLLSLEICEIAIVSFFHCGNERRSFSIATNHHSIDFKPLPLKKVSENVINHPFEIENRTFQCVIV